MAYQGIINEMITGDTAVRNWYTWQVTIPALATPGIHTFQFFEHYYVWQDEDQYWADFNSQSTIKSFTIRHSLPTPPQPTTSNSSKPYTSPSSQASRSDCQPSPFSPMEILNTTATALVMINIVGVAALTTKEWTKRFD
jgi:hypothetical protein